MTAGIFRRKKRNLSAYFSQFVHAASNSSLTSYLSPGNVRNSGDCSSFLYSSKISSLHPRISWTVLARCIDAHVDTVLDERWEAALDSVRESLDSLKLCCWTSKYKADTSPVSAGSLSTKCVGEGMSSFESTWEFGGKVICRVGYAWTSVNDEER